MDYHILSTTIKNTIPKKHFIALSLIFIIVNLSLYSYLGIKVMSDSLRYLEWANVFWEAGVESRMIFYLSYVLFVSFFIKTGLGTEAIIFTQVVISYIALNCLYLLTYRISTSKITSFLTALIYIGWVEIASWNMYVLTESLFTSSIIIFLYLLSHNYSKKGSLLYLIPFFAFVVFLRPMGITVLIAVAVYLYYHFDFRWKYQKRHKRLIITGLITLLLLAVIGYMEGNPSVDFFYANGKTVWGADSFEQLKDNTWLVVDKQMISAQKTSEYATISFIEFALNNYEFLTELFFKKTILFIAHIKPYYSLYHNVFIIITLLPIYCFSVYGLIQQKSNREIKYFTIALFVFNMLMTGFTVEAWDGRFLIPVLPLLFVYSAIGITHSTKKIVNYSNPLSNNSRSH